jgi:preprotein translocase subunit SecY
MKRLFKTLRDIFSIEELRGRILFTLLMLAIFRFGSFVILPGIDSKALADSFRQQGGGGILDLVNLFVGGAFGRGAIFALGIMPYISASIILQLMGAVVPAIQKIQKEGESGIRKINQLTRYLTVGITAVQAAAYVVNLQTDHGNAIVADAYFFWISTIFVLTAGTMFLVWVGERITENGIGNGVSLIIAIGIIADLPLALITEFQANPVMIFFVEILALGLVTMAVVLLTTGTRKIPVNYARRMVGNKMMGSMTTTARQYIPLKLNSANVMPIIFAQAIMFIPATIFQFQIFQDSDFWMSFQQAFSDYTSVGYNIVFAALIILFSYFYTALVVNPQEIADQLKRQGGFIPGVKPGKQTSEFIDEVLTRITLPGALFLAAVAIMPAIVASLGVSNQFAMFFGGTSLLIMIGVVLDTLQQIESHLKMRHYDGLMKSGRLLSRNQVGAPTL